MNVVVAEGDRARGGRRAQHRRGRPAAPEFLEYQTQFDQARAGAAVTFGQREAGPAQLRDVGVLGRDVSRSVPFVHDPVGAVTLVDEPAGGLGQLALLGIPE